jgi:F0F1-type ATP synthase membrane subunit c/vacuolar-type H+-ATPase subunit K
VGPLTLTGLALFGAAVAIGQVASRPARAAASNEVTPARRLAFILIAFATGCGVAGVVVGVLAIEFGRPGDSMEAPIAAGLGIVGAVVGVLAIEFGRPGDSMEAPIAAGLGIVGAVVGLLPIIRDLGVLDSWVVRRAAPFIAGLAVLSVVIAVLASVIDVPGETSAQNGAFLVLGLISAAGVIGLGIVGRRMLDDVEAAPATKSAAQVSRAIARIIPFELVAYSASIAGILLVVAN